MKKFRNLLMRIRKNGVPHEESVIITVIAIIFCVNMFIKRALPLSVAVLLAVAITYVCGLWLGIAWKRYPAFKVLLRVYYIGVLCAIGAAMFDPEVQTRKDYFVMAAQITSTFGVVYYVGWSTGSVVRDLALDFFPSPAHRERALQKRERLRYLVDLARDKESAKDAGRTDWFLSTLIKNFVSPAGLVLGFTILGGVYTFIRYGVDWLYSK